MNISQLRYRTTVILSAFTLKRFFNLVNNQIEYLQKKSILSGYPRSVSLELNNYCNLKCESCPTHINTSKRAKRHITIDELKIILEKLKGFNYNLSIGGNGEVTIVPKIEKYVELARKKNMFVFADTNFNCSKKVVYKLFKAGISMVNISLDGTTEKTYSTYRKGGSFKTVFANLLYLIDLKKKHKSIFPKIRWQFIINKYNEHEVEKAKQLAKQLKTIELRLNLPFVPGGDNFVFNENKQIVNKISEKFLPLSEKFRIKGNIDLLTCYQSFSELQILCNGDIVPCCRLREKNIIAGNIFSSELKDIWNNNMFQYFRKQLKNQGNCPDCLNCLKNMNKYLKNKKNYDR